MLVNIAVDFFAFYDIILKNTAKKYKSLNVRGNMKDRINKKSIVLVLAALAIVIAVSASVFAIYKYMSQKRAVEAQLLEYVIETQEYCYEIFESIDEDSVELNKYRENVTKAGTPLAKAYAIKPMYDYVLNKFYLLRRAHVLSSPDPNDFASINFFNKITELENELNAKYKRIEDEMLKIS